MDRRPRYLQALIVLSLLFLAGCSSTLTDPYLKCENIASNGQCIKYVISCLEPLVLTEENGKLACKLQGDK